MAERKSLGKVQHRIMQVLWQHGRATAREITDALCREEPIAHSTVQTLLRKLEAKGVVTHEAEERTFVFLPVVAEDEVTASATRDLVTRLFGGSAFGMVAYLLRHERISPEELAHLRALIDEDQKP